MSGQLRIRMYRQGLGDCFLLTIPSEGQETHVLIDCGVLKGTRDAQVRMRAVAQNIFDTTNHHLDVLVITHEHWDHVSGLLQADTIFNSLTIGEIWLAWTEKSDDELAIELRQRKAKVLKAIVSAAAQLKKMFGLGARRVAGRLGGLLQFYGVFGADGRRTTADAMAWAKGREQSAVRFLYPQQTFMVPGTSGIRVYVLGPPHEASKIRRSRPSRKSGEVYELAAEGTPDFGFLAALEGDATGTVASEKPFEDWFVVGEVSAGQNGFFTHNYWQEQAEWRRIEDDWLQAAGQLALQLDSHTNNTSLVLAFELPGTQRVLLFPGDAQVGNWLSWEGLSWTLQENGSPRTVTGDSLVARTVFYKVGHHGSHNATLREKGLELMASDELVAMIPVNRETASQMEWNMPFPSLLRRLEEKTKGRILDSDKGIATANPGLLGDKEWQRFVAQTDVSDEWIDYRIPL